MTTPKHYLNQCWFIIRCVLWHSAVSNSPEVSLNLSHNREFGYYTCNINITTTSPLLGASYLTSVCFIHRKISIANKKFYWRRLNKLRCLNRLQQLGPFGGTIYRIYVWVGVASCLCVLENINNDQNDCDVRAKKVHRDSTYIISFLTRHDEPLNNDQMRILQ